MECNRNNTLHKFMSSNTGSKTAHFFNLFWLLYYLSTILFLITSFFFNATNSQKKARPHSFSRRCAWSRLARTRACLLFARGGASWRRRSGCSEANVNALARDESDQRGGRGGENGLVAGETHSHFTRPFSQLKIWLAFIRGAGLPVHTLRSCFMLAVICWSLARRLTDSITRRLVTEESFIYIYIFFKS